MKRTSRLSLTTLAVSTALLAAALTAAPALRAEDPAPASSPAASSGTDDIFDVIKKGADKLQKEAKAQKDMGPQLKALNDKQNELLRRHIELEKHLQAILLKQEEAIQHLEKTVAKLDKECEECKASATTASPSPKPSAAPLPMTEPTPSPSPSVAP